jgi:hypothetical protein
MIQQNRVKITVAFCLLLIAASGLATEMPLPLDPNYSIPGLVTNSSLVFTIPQVAKPSYGIPFIDPIFGTIVTRIAGDYGQGLSWSGPPPGSGTWGSDARHHYSKDQPWSSDGGLIVIENSGEPSILVLDGETYQVRYGRCSNYDLGDDRWHPRPQYPYNNIRINANGSTLEWFDVTTCTQVRSWILPFSANYFGSCEGNPSFDGRFAVLSTLGGTQACVVDMDPQPPFAPYPNKRIGPVYTGIPVGGMQFDWVSVSPSGKYCVVAYDAPNTDHLRVFDINSTTLEISVRPMPAGSLECPCHTDVSQGWIYHLGHADMTLNPFDANEDVIIGQFRSGYCPSKYPGGSTFGKVIMVRLKDNKVLTLTKGSNEGSVHHISTRSYDRPGWAYAGYYTSSGKRFGGEVIAVKLDGSGTVERYVHHHSGESVYRAEVHAVPSRDGRRVLFASDWTINCNSGCGTSSNPQAYVVDTTPVGDLTHGGHVDFGDLGWFLLSWLDSGCDVPDWCEGADLDENGTVDLVDYSILAEQWLGDVYTYTNPRFVNTPPDPDPTTWESVPVSETSTTITMTADTATDFFGVEYFFHNVTDPNHDSGWQDGVIYTDTLLIPDTNYEYQVKARDKSVDHMETAYSETASARTLAYSNQAVFFSDDFEDYEEISTKWDVLPSTRYVYITDEAAYTGTYSVEIRTASSIKKQISTVGYSDIRVRYARKVDGGDPYDTGEYLYAEWSTNGTNWNILEQTQQTTWAYKDFVCDPNADDNPNFQIRFRTTANLSGEYAYVDSIELYVITTE